MIQYDGRTFVVHPEKQPLELKNGELIECTLPKQIKKTFNPRWLAYAKAHGKTPKEMLRADREKYQGGQMAGYIVWATGKWQEWRKERNYPSEMPLCDEDIKAFDAWLQGKEEK